MPQTNVISVIVPCYNEAANIEPFYLAFRKIARRLPDRMELLFVDDGSGDDTLQAVHSLARRDNRVRSVELVRNFGKEIAITAGLHQAHGDAAIVIDADLQHPPDIIPEFIQRWRDGAEVVVGVRKANKAHTSIFKRFTSRWFYRFMGVISDTALTPNATDYRLLDRVVIDEFNRFTERNRLTRGLIDWLGFRHDYVYFEPAQRMHGTATYSYRKLAKLAVNSIVSLSLFPLRLAGWLGSAITLVAIIMGSIIFGDMYLLGDPLNLHVSGTAQLAIILLFLVGIILVCLGLISLYVASIYGEVVNRPLYVARREEDQASTGVRL